MFINLSCSAPEIKYWPLIPLFGIWFAFESCDKLLGMNWRCVTGDAWPVNFYKERDKMATLRMDTLWYTTKFTFLGFFGFSICQTWDMVVKRSRSTCRAIMKTFFTPSFNRISLPCSSTLNPFTPTSDQDRISPYNINTISSRQVMRI